MKLASNKKAVKAPETITHRGQTLNLYRSQQTKGAKTYTTWFLTYVANGQRQRKGFADEAKARAAAKTIADQLAEGTGHAHALTPAEVADYSAATREARRLGRQATLTEIVGDYVAAAANLPAGVTMRDAIASFRKTHDGAKALSAATVADMVERFEASRKKGGASERYLEDIHLRLARFKKAFRCQIGSVTTTEITAWLDKLKVGARTRKNYLGAVAALFSFARRQGCLPRNEKTEAELVEPVRPKPGKVGIYTAAELRILLHGLPERLRLPVAVAAFAGVRSAEIYRLDWSEVNSKAGHIVVAAHKAKTAQRRLVPILPALAAWISAHEGKREGKLIGPGFSFASALDRVLRREIAALNERRKAAGESPVPRLHNALRHSFASYRLAIVKSAAQVALEMGNSPRKLFENYRELVTAAAAKAWFNVRPASAPGNVVQMRAVA